MSDEFKDLNILLFVKDPENLSSAVKFLDRRGLNVKVAQSTKDAIEYTISKRPKYVFISWNAPFKTIKLKQIFEDTFGVKAIVFAELTDSRTAAQLAVSGLSDPMKAPISGPGILVRIKAMEQEEKEELNFGPTPVAEKNINLACPAKSIPKIGSWERSKKEQNIWYFNSKKKVKMFGFEGKIKYRGDEPPKQDVNNGWQANERFLSFEVDEEKVKEENAQKEAAEQKRKQQEKESKEKQRKEETRLRREEAIKREEEERRRKEEYRKKQAFERELARKQREEYLEKKRLENKLRAEARKKSYGKVQYTQKIEQAKQDKESSIKYKRGNPKESHGNLSLFEGSKSSSGNFVNKGEKGAGQNYLEKGEKASSRLMLDKGWQGEKGSNYMNKGEQKSGPNYMNKGEQQKGSNYMDKGEQQKDSNYMDKGEQQKGSSYMDKEKKPENKMYMEDGKTNSEEKGNNPQNNTEFGKVHKKDNKQADQGFVDQQSEAQAAANKGDVAGELGGLYDKTGAIPKGETLKEGKDFYKTRDKTFKSQVCKAVDETCKESDFPVPIHQVKKIHCLILETQRHKGFLVLTTSGFIDESFIEKLKQNLGHTLVIIHDLVVSLEVIDMKTEGLRFKEWAFEKAHFQYFSSHENHEIGVCYFDARDVFSQMVEPSGNELEPIPVENINHNSTVDMDLFIFLEKNKRYLKYIRRNGALSKKQKEKILASSISDFYIHSEDLRAYKRMLSRYYLEKLLEDDEESIKPNNSDKAA